MKIVASLLGCVCVLLVLASSAFAAFGLTAATDYYTVDTGAGLVFKVRRTDNGVSTQSAGDLMSMVYNGVEYQDQSRGSQLNSGFDYLYTGVNAVSVNAQVVNTNYILVTVVAGNLTHYYMARNGYPHIYMATYFTTEPDTLGLCRFIVRIPSTLLTNGPAPSDIRNNTGAIESADIFGMADGTTRSKHYSNMRLKDWSYIGATGTNVGVWMVRSNHEGDSGGPFYRSLLNQCGTDQEITYIINYGEAQTEAFRTNILDGPYTLVFTTGVAPGALDTSWVANMGLTGYVGASGRGIVTGSAITGRDTNYAYTVGFSNANAQYWTDAAPGNGAFTTAGMIPGTYTMSVYKNELAVYSAANVTVAAGGITAMGTIAINNDPSQTVALWRIGNWDGTPAEFLNGDKVTFMHPSDVRMTAWSPGTYIISTSKPAIGMPCYQWKDVNGNQSIQFNLSQAQIIASTIRVGLTTAYAGGRPNIIINSTTAALQSPSTQPDSRTLTVGSYRGNNVTYTFNVAASALVAGTNTLTVYPISGSSGTTYLSPGYSLDCVDLIQGNQAVVPPAAPASLTASSGDAQASLSWSAVSGATGYNVLRGAVSGGPYAMVASGLAATSYTDTGLTNGATYRYVVTASNGSGAGVFSPEAAVTPSVIPSAPLGLTAMAGDTTIALSWSASSAATSYNLKRSLTRSSGYVTIQNLTSLNYTDTGLTDGTIYYYVVSGVNAMGEGANSTEASATPVVIQTLTAASVAAQDGYIRESGSATGVGATAQTNPLRAGDDSSNRQYKAILSFDTSTLPANATVLSATLKLRCSAITGTSPFTSNGTCYVDLKGGSGFNGNVAFESADFQAPADAVQIATLSSVAVVGGVSSATMNASALPLINKTGYTQFRAYFSLATNNDSVVNYVSWNAGDDATAAYRPTLALTYTVPVAPNAPTGLTATGGNGQVVLQWNAPGGAASYTVSRSTTSGSGYTVLSNAVTAASYTDTAVSNGTTYYYVVSATNSVGTSVNSAEASARPAQSFAQWLAAAFPGQTDPAVIGPAADPDHDGYPNLFEYFQGTSPLASDVQGGLTGISDGKGNMVLAFRMSKNTTGVTCSIQQSTNLLSWIDSGAVGSVVSDQGGYYLMNATVPLGSQVQLFLRLTVSQP